MERIFTKSFILLTLGNFASAIYFYLLMTSISVYAEQSFGSGQSLAGLAGSIFLIGALVSRLIAGKLMDVVGRKRLLLISVGFSVFLMFAYVYAAGIYVLIVVRFIHGALSGMGSTIFTTSAIASLPESRRGEGNGYFSISVAAGMATGPLLANLIIASFGYRILFYFCMIVTAASFLLALAAEIEEVSADRKAEFRAKLKSFAIWDILEKKAVPASLIMFAGGIGFAGILSFTNSYARSIELPTASSMLFMVYAVCLVVSRPAAGRLYDKKGENIVAYPSIVLFSLTYVTLGFANASWFFIVAGILLAFGYGSQMALFQAVVANAAEPHRIGVAVSTFYICLDIGTGAGGYIIGALVDFVGFRTMYYIIAVLLILMAPVYRFVHGRKHSRR